jgi:hypothetical protein
MADAMPLLEQAGSIEVVIIANERGKQDEIEGADMGQHLARHGLKVEVKRITRDKISTSPTCCFRIPLTPMQIS